MFKHSTEGIGVSPSMEGATPDDIDALAQHLREHAPLGIDGKEAMRMARAQQPRYQIETTRFAIEISMRELIEGLRKAA